MDFYSNIIIHEILLKNTKFLFLMKNVYNLHKSNCFYENTSKTKFVSSLLLFFFLNKNKTAM